MQRIKDNLWRGYGIVALAYMIFWWIELFVWYFPFYYKFWDFFVQDALPIYETRMAFLFISVGMLAMIFSFYIVWACFKRTFERSKT
jgi:hypothetical protein